MANINAYLRKDGRWEVRLYSTDVTGKRRYKSIYGQTKGDAERKALYLYNSISEPCPLTKMTVKDLILEYIHRKQPLLKASTGELCALQWKDIDLEKRILTVNKTIQRIQTSSSEKKTMLVITAPKSQGSVREIPLPECIVDILKQYRENNALFVLSASKKPVEPRTLQYRFAKILNNADLPSVHFHSLRHAFATNCVAAGFDVKTLSEILGHSSVELTLNRYVHSSMDRKRAFMDMLTWDKASA